MINYQKFKFEHVTEKERNAIYFTPKMFLSKVWIFGQNLDVKIFTIVWC